MPVSVWRRALIPATAALVGILALPGCGGGSTTTVIERTVVSQTSQTSAPSQADCPSSGQPNVVNLSVSGMSCSEAVAVITDFGSISTAFNVDGFACGQLSGTAISGVWRCTQGAKSFRFGFAD